MSRELPASPNLEHLRKQAKALLETFQNKNPQAIEAFSALQLKRVPKLSDAQLLIAREYGFTSWPKLNEHVQAIIVTHAVREVRKAFQEDDLAAFRRLLADYPLLREKINDPIGDFDSPLINHVRSVAMLDLLLDAGADINARSQWKAGGFGLLDSADPAVSAHAIKRGAVVTIHAAARLSMYDRLKKLIAADPQLVHAPGGDGQTPLHFAATIEIAEYLLDHGAEIDARDVDHESTPAQYMLRKRPDVARYLIRRGCQTDLLMAAALSDIALAKKRLQADPDCIRTRVSDEYFPMISPRNGGSIYQWELGWYVSAVQVAKSFGHQEMFDLLMERSPAEEKLLNACWLHDEEMVHSLLAQNSDLTHKLPVAGRRHVAHAARNNDTDATRLMLGAGLPVNSFSQHHATPLHWAAFHGNTGMIRLLLSHHSSLEDDDNEYKGTPLGWAMYGSQNGWHQGTGDYVGAVEELIGAGAELPREIGGSDAVKAVLRRSRTK